MNKKAKTWGVIIFIAILAAVAMGDGFNYALTGDIKPIIQGTVGLPNFASAKCQAGSLEARQIEGSIEYDMSNAPHLQKDAPIGSYYHIKEFGCTGTNTKQCVLKYNVQQTIYSLKIYKVPLSYSFTTFTDLYNKGLRIVSGTGYINSGDGWNEAGTFNFNSEYYTPTEKMIVIADDVPLGGWLDTGDLKIKIEAQQYDLDSTTDRGLRNIMLNSCDLSKIHTSGTVRDVLERDFLSGLTYGDVKKIAEGKYVVPFDRAVNYIASLSPVSETQDIIKRNGIWVWVMQPKVVCPIENSPPEFGNKKYYADCRQTIAANEIICMPSMPNCKPDGLGYLTAADPKTCNFYGGGLPVGYYPNYLTGNYKEYCKFTCEGGVVKTNSCVTLQNCAAGEKFDFNAGKCVQMGGGNYTGGTETDYLPYLIIGAAILLGILVLAYVMNDK